MAKTNAQVIRAFLDRKEARAANLHSTGTSLWSYGWWECARWVGGELITRNGPSYSATTASKHRRVWTGQVSGMPSYTNSGPMNLDRPGEVWERVAGDMPGLITADLEGVYVSECGSSAYFLMAVVGPAVKIVKLSRRHKVTREWRAGRVTAAELLHPCHSSAVLGVAWYIPGPAGLELCERVSYR